MAAPSNPAYDMSSLVAGSSVQTEEAKTDNKPKDPKKGEWTCMLGDIVYCQKDELWFAKSIKGTTDMQEKFRAPPITAIADNKKDEKDTKNKPNINDENTKLPDSPSLVDSELKQETSISRMTTLELTDSSSKKKKKKKKTKIKKAVFVSFKVKRLSSVQNVEQTFRMKFHIYFNWIPTEDEYNDYITAKEENRLHEWEPRWYPHLEFVNEVESHKCDWEKYPSGGQFRIQTFPDFGCIGKGDDKTRYLENLINSDSEHFRFHDRHNDNSDGKDSKQAENEEKIEFKCENTRFIRAKMDCDITFSEVFELNNFPLDCQDLTCVIEERSKDIVCKFMPELRNENFTGIEQTYSVINEWSLKNAILQLGLRTAGRTSQTHPIIELRLKIERKWHVFFSRIIFFVLCMCIMDLTAFSLDYNEDLGDRLALIVTLILTIVAFSIAVDDQIPNVPYLTYLEKYILSCYMFTTFTMIQTAISSYTHQDTESDDPLWFGISNVVLILFHVIFFFYGLRVRVDEKRKLYMTGDELRELDKEKIEGKKKLTYNKDLYEEYEGNKRHWKNGCLEYRADENTKVQDITQMRLLKNGIAMWFGSLIDVMNLCVRMCSCLCDRNGNNAGDYVNVNGGDNDGNRRRVRENGHQRLLH